MPVGKDQVQHLEMTRDMARSFNPPTATTSSPSPACASKSTPRSCPGLDGRKMSKSYDNTIPLFVSDEDLKRACHAR